MRHLAIAAAVAAAMTAATFASAQPQQQGDQAAAPQEQPVYGYGPPNATVSTPPEPPAIDQQEARIPEEKQLAYPTDKREPSLARELTDMVQQRKQQK